MKGLLIALLLGFGVALAVIIGQRMSTDAMAVVIGVAVGVAASVPTSLLLVALLRRERQGGRAEQPPAYPPHGYPPAGQPPQIVVLDPSQWQPRNGYGNPGYTPLPPPDYGRGADGGLPRLRVIGDDGDEGW